MYVEQGCMQFSTAHGAPWPLPLSLPSGPGAEAWCRGPPSRAAAGPVHEHFPLSQVGLPLRGTSKMGALFVFNVFCWELRQWPPCVSCKKNVWKVA